MRPLNWAISKGSKHILSQDPKQIDLVDAKGRTVLARAIRSGKQEVVEFLLASGATEDIYAAVDCRRR